MRRLLTSFLPRFCTGALLLTVLSAQAERLQPAITATFSSFRDPGLLELKLKNGDSLEIGNAYNSIGFEELSSWTAGEAIEIGYSKSKGAVLIRTKTSKYFPIHLRPPLHPISILSKNCTDQAVSTLEISICFDNASLSWDREIERVKQDLIARHGAGTEIHVQVDAIQKAWNEYKRTYFALRKDNFSQRGTIEIIEWSAMAARWRKDFYITLLSLR